MRDIPQLEKGYEPSGEPNSPLEWMNYLSGELGSQVAKTKPYRDAYDATDQPIDYAQQKFREIFGEMFHGWRDSFCSLIVDSISERLSPQGFRFNQEQKDEEVYDEEAQKIWQRSYLDADSNAAHIDALVQGSSYLINWVDDDGEQVIIPESASNVIVKYVPGSRRKVHRGYREFIDDWGATHATLWDNQHVYTLIRGTEKGAIRNEPEVHPNPYGVVPITELSNRKRLKPGPFSELAAILPIQKAINKVAADAIIASEFAAFPQRVIMGLEPFEDTDEERNAMLKAYIDRILAFDGEDVKIDQWDAADLGNYVKLIDMLVQHMASQSRVPFHYFLLNGGQAPSGESITAAEAGLVAKAKERMLHFGESWEMAMRIAFKGMGDEARAKAYDAECVWDRPEKQSEGVLLDAAVKKRELNIPDKQIWEDLGYSASQIKRFPEMMEAQMKRDKEWADKYTPEHEKRMLAQPGQGQGQKAPAKNASAERQKEKANRAA